MRSIADRTQPWMVRVITWTGTRLGRCTLATAVILLWFAVVAQVYIGQFLNYRGALAWLNQPLIQLPYTVSPQPSPPQRIEVSKHGGDQHRGWRG